MKSERHAKIVELIGKYQIETQEELSAYLVKDDIAGFFGVIKASGESSAMLLQNYFTPKAPEEQGITLACAAANSVLAPEGVCRVHGGGFAGTIQAFVRSEDVAGFRALMDSVFGEGACIVLRVRGIGAGKVI